MKTFNKKGDTGETSLLYGGRVPKSDLHCEAYGTIDEAVSALGLARCLSGDPRVSETVLSLQKEFFTIAAELATSKENYPQFKTKFKFVTEEMAAALEKKIEELEQEIRMPREFIIPGKTQCSAALDLARSIIRRAERRAVDLKNRDLLVNENILRYLNRAADLVFTLARYEEQK